MLVLMAASACGLLFCSSLSAQQMAGRNYSAIDPASQVRSKNVNPSSPYEKTQVQANILMNLDRDTDQFHFIRDNNDPYVVTKTYVLKNADPYEIRPFVRSAVMANRVKENNTTVECIKYNDGKGVLIVSAEEYRFKSHDNGMSIDEIVAALDKPSVTSSSGQTTFVYFPKYWTSRDLAQLVKNVGANIEGDDVELQRGMDHIDYDSGLNCMFMYIPRYGQKNIEKMLKLYDTPTYEVEVKYSVYEIYAENDAKIGADFQAWKNNGGSDLFAAGGRYRDNWSATWDGGASKNGSNNTGYVNFNPKWNTRYLDFLVSTGKSSVVTSGELLVMNQATGKVECRTNMYNFENGDKIPDKAVISGCMFPSGNFYVSTTAAAAGIEGGYRIVACDSSGTPVDFAADFAGQITVSRIQNATITSYFVRVSSGSGNLVKNGSSVGSNAQCFSFSLEKVVKVADPITSSYNYEWVAQTDWSNAIDIVTYKDTKVVTNPATVGYGFTMTLVPVICEESSTVSISMLNDSLTGWNSNGTPRITRDSSVNTKVMLSNKGSQFVIGGLEKKNVVKGVSGVPFLKSIPFLGYLFSTESESTKKAQLVLVIDLKLKDPDSPVKSPVSEDLLAVNKKTVDAGVKIEYGFDQYYLDKDKK
jgi:hypothetical protein